MKTDIIPRTSQKLLLISGAAGLIELLNHHVSYNEWGCVGTEPGTQGRAWEHINK